MALHRPTHKMPERAIKAWRLGGLVAWVFELSLPIGYFVLSRRFDGWPLWPFFVLGGLVILLGIWHVFIAPPLKMLYWGYNVEESSIDIQRGIIIIRRTLIPMARIQHVDTERGPILRLYKLASLVVATAGNEHRIPALSHDRAHALRDQIAALTESSDDDV